MPQPLPHSAPPSLLNTVVHAALALARADMANLQLVQAGRLVVAAHHGFKPDFLKFFDVVEGDDCACGSALRSLATTVVHDVRTSPIFFGKPSMKPVLEAGVLSVVSTPIIGRTRLLGMLSTHRRSVGAPDLGRLKRLEWLANQAARILEGSASGVIVQGIESLARI